MSTASRAMNASYHTLTDLKTLAQAAPEEAEGYLRAVAVRLQRSGQVAGAEAISQLLQAQGDLVARIDARAAQLGQIFPANMGEWAQLQDARVNGVGWAPADPNGGLTYLKGTVTHDGTSFLLTTAGGRVYDLADSGYKTTTWMSSSMVAGMMVDGTVSVQGQLAADGRTFNLEGFALNVDGRYDSFTYARVVVNGDDVTLDTPRGAVQLSDPAFKAKLKAMPKLGVILPGEPTTAADGTRVYDGNPNRFFGLARFGQTAVSPADAEHPTPYALGDMAYSSFKGKPITIPPGAEARVNNTGRLWVEGDVKLDAAGVAQGWESTWVGVIADAINSFGDVPTGPVADPVETAVITTEAGV